MRKLCCSASGSSSSSPIPASGKQDPPSARQSSKDVTTEDAFSRLGEAGNTGDGASTEKPEVTGSPMASFPVTRPGQFNPWVRGNPMRVIFTCVSLDKADIMTHVLREDVIPVVNSVARILHDSVLSWGGTIIGNSGLTFVFAWPLPESLAESEVIQLIFCFGFCF